MADAGEGISDYRTHSKAREVAKADAVVIERAKLILRRRGCVVYNAEVVRGPRGHYKYNGRLVTEAELLKAAGL